MNRSPFERVHHPCPTCGARTWRWADQPEAPMCGLCPGVVLPGAKQKPADPIDRRIRDLEDLLETTGTIARQEREAVVRLRPGHSDACTTRYVHGDGECSCGALTRTDISWTDEQAFAMLEAWAENEGTAAVRSALAHVKKRFDADRLFIEMPDNQKLLTDNKDDDEPAR